MEENLFDKVVALAKRRGFVFPSSEIYGGLANTWDFGPYGVLLKNNLRDLWWQNFVLDRDDMYGIEASIFLNPKVWEASGHVAGFADALIDCKSCKFRTRADHLIEENIADKKVKAIGFKSPYNFYEQEKILGIEGNRKNSILYKFLLTEKENDDGFVPEFFEVAFGNINSKYNNPDNPHVDISTGTVKIRGKIDRVDINHKEKTFKVVDYKLGGRKPTTDDLLNGISLQLPLYMFAAKEIIKVQLHQDYAPAGAEIFSLKNKDGDFGKFPINISDKKLPPAEGSTVYDELIKITLAAIEKYVEQIGQGKFNLSVLKDRENAVCRYCGFKPVCRVQEIS